MRATAVFILVLACACGGREPSPGGASTGEAEWLPSTRGLRSVRDFDGLSGERRARAIFAELGKVLTHPRCINCHPSGDIPAQREGLRHQPLVVRGADGFGAPGMRCSTCHGTESYLNVPGSPGWHLAPASMAWQGRSLHELCRQLKDPARNGGKSLAELGHHLEHDALVAYGWAPPAHLAAAPGSQALTAQLFRAWVDAGASCPTPSPR